MVKKIFKWLGIILLTVIVIGGSFAAYEWNADKPVRFRSFVDREVLKMAFESPETLTSLGFLESLGITGHNAKLDDASLAKADELYVKLKQVHETLNSYDNESLSEADLLSKEIALYLLDFAKESEKFRYHSYPVNQLFGIQNGYPSFMEAQHQINSVDDVENYLSRLNLVKNKFTQELEGIKLREEKGIIPPLFVIERVLEEMNTFVNKPIEENILYTSMAKKME
ncbi:MAG: DUF885 family protein, partial [Thalassotalea sp.]|nr:DUF885 family protein [Thalassotalea sp.]